MKIFCVIPAYQEENNIKKVINEVLDLVDFLIIVDDGSSDQTYQVANEIISDKLKVLQHPINLGQGAALQTGNEYALKKGADIIVHFDADGQFLSQEIKKLVTVLIEEDLDIVFGSRFLEIKSDLPPLKKNLIMPLARIFNRLFFGIKTSDPQSGFRVFKARVASEIEIENNRMAHCTEILAKVHQKKLKMKEVAITVLYSEFGQKFSGSFKIIKDLFFKKISK
ncbi:MAG: glycosyltransferase family 2 protein [Patescibacteria group bacterium]|jgi:glycosyltransferase involved in cell wall biosynthesis|nr:glycosyltransferase family 2 protein [Patescibacteria group bacterium]